jgi:hypothetical protein
MIIKVLPQRFGGSFDAQACAGDDQAWTSHEDRPHFEWTAERTWEDDGGRVSREPRARKIRLVAGAL